MIVASIQQPLVRPFPQTLARKTELTLVNFGTRQQGTPFRKRLSQWHHKIKENGGYKAWVKRGTTDKLANKLGEKYKWSKAKVAVASLVIYNVLLIGGHAAGAPYIYRKTIDLYRSGVKTMSDVAEFANGVIDPEDEFTKRDTVVNGKRQIIFEEKE